MARPERYFIGPAARNKLQDVFAAHDGAASGGDNSGINTRLQGLYRQPRRSRYFRTNEEMPACGSAYGTEVKIASPDCIQVDDIEDPETVELFDVSNSVRVFNLVKQRGIDSALPVGSIVEAISEPQTSSEEVFWRVLQVLSCDCGGSSGSGGSSTSGSSTSGSASYSTSSGSSGSASSDSSSSSSSSSSSDMGSGSGSGSGGSGGSGGTPPCTTIDVVTDVQCVDGSIQVTKTSICVPAG